MDTLTQLTLGAACGEAVLGKKIGNRAMLWGAFGGLLPDLDTAASFFTDEITALAFHRAFMHSITFAVLASLALGWLVDRLYRTGFYRRRGYKLFVTVALLGLYTFIIIGIQRFLGDALRGWGWSMAALVGGLGLAALCWGFYLRKELQPVEATQRGWAWLFFMAIFTHPVLDCFTVFGTQLFQPFSDYRVSFDNISVVDPGYTVPLMLGVLVASLLAREKKARYWANWTGILLSSAFMAFTFYHKAEFNRIFQESLATKGIEYRRFMSGPSILNNFLWLGVAETDDAYYHGYYTFFDKEPKIRRFYKLPKNHELLAAYQGDRAVRVLTWFSKGFYNVIRRKDGRLQYNDLRYGGFEEGFRSENDYVFKFILEEKSGRLDATQSREGRKINGAAFNKYLKRIFAQTEGQ